MIRNKYFKRMVFAIVGLFGQNLCVHAGFFGFSSKNLGISAIQENSKEAKAFFPIPGFGFIGGGLSSKVTDVTFHTQLAERLWREARENLKCQEGHLEYAPDLQRLEQQFRNLLVKRLEQVIPSQKESLLQASSPEIANARLTVQEMFETLKALNQEAVNGDKQAQAKALQAMSDLIQVAKDELNLIQRVDQGKQADTQEAQVYKGQWQAFVQQSYQAFLHQQEQPEMESQRLRVQAFSAQATFQDWYDYANHLLTYQLCPQSDENIINHLIRAAQGGCQPAALKLLAIYVPQEAGQEMGEVYFRLFQLQVNESSPFTANVRIHFLARAILHRYQPALKYLDQQVQADINKGVSRSSENQQWHRLRQCLNRLAIQENEEKQAYLKALNQRVKSSYQTQVLHPVSDLALDVYMMSASESDDECTSPPFAVQIRTLENENQQLTQHLQQAQANHADTQRQFEALQAQLQAVSCVKRQTQAKLISLCQAYQDYRVAYQENVQLKKDYLSHIAAMRVLLKDMREGEYATSMLASEEGLATALKETLSFVDPELLKPSDQIETITTYLQEIVQKAYQNLSDELI